MRQLLHANLKFHWRRYLATGLAVVIAVIFVVAVFAVRDGINSSISRSLIEEYSGADAVVLVDAPSESTPNAQETVTKLRGVSGVEEAAAVTQVATALGSSGDRITSTSVLLPEPFFQPSLIEGTFPQNENEVALDRRTAEGLGKSPGDTVSLTGFSGEVDEPQSFTVSGIFGESESTLVNLSSSGALLTQAGLGLLTGGAGDEWVERYLVAGTPGTSPEDLVTAVSASLGEDFRVQTVTQVMDEQLEDLNLSTAQMSLVLMIFPAIAIVVAIIVVSNTFKVLIQQRQKELGLLRCVGATSGQVRRLLLFESALLGVIAGALGIVLGVVLSAWGVAAAGLVPSFAQALASLSLPALVAVFVAAVLVTVLSGLRPASRIAKAPPLVTFTAAEAEPTRRSGGWWARLIIGAIITAAGAAGMVFAARLPNAAGLGIAILLGPVTLLGLTIFLSAAFPGIATLVGGLWRTNLGRLARGNTARNPGRTAATGVSVVIGVSLIVMMMVGAASVSQTLNAKLDSRMGTDLEISTPEGNFTAADVQAVKNVDGISAAAAERSVSNGADLDGEEVTIYDAGTAQSVLRSGEPLVSEGEVLVSPGWGLAVGDTVSLCVAGVCEELTAVENTSWNASLSSVGVSTANFDKFARGADAQTRVILAQLESSADFDFAADEIEHLNPEWTVGGMAPLRAQFDQMISVILTGMVALLAVSVVIALVGVSNTLALSVAERTREFGLLRALGMTRRQTSRLLTTEAILISFTASVIGILAGIFFGWVGSIAVLSEFGSVRFAIPWWQLAVVLAISLLAAVLASWLPGRRAGRVSPVQALSAT